MSQLTYRKLLLLGVSKICIIATPFKEAKATFSAIQDTNGQALPTVLSNNNSTSTITLQADTIQNDNNASGKGVAESQAQGDQLIFDLSGYNFSTGTQNALALVRSQTNPTLDLGFALQNSSANLKTFTIRNSNYSLFHINNANSDVDEIAIQSKVVNGQYLQINTNQGIDNVKLINIQNQSADSTNISITGCLIDLTSGNGNRLIFANNNTLSFLNNKSPRIIISQYTTVTGLDHQNTVLVEIGNDNTSMIIDHYGQFSVGQGTAYNFGNQTNIQNNLTNQLTFSDTALVNAYSQASKTMGYIVRTGSLEVDIEVGGGSRLSGKIDLGIHHDSSILLTGGMLNANGNAGCYIPIITGDAAQAIRFYKAGNGVLDAPTINAPISCAAGSGKGAIQIEGNCVINAQIGAQGSKISSFTIFPTYSATLNSNALAIYADNTLLDNGSNLIVNLSGNNFNTAVNSRSLNNKYGTVTFAAPGQVITLQQHIGNAVAVDTVVISPLVTLQNNGQVIKANNQILLSGTSNNPATLELNGVDPGPWLGPIKTANANENNIVVSTNYAVPCAIGVAGTAVGQILIKDGVTLTTAAGLNIHANQIILGSKVGGADATLVIGNGAPNTIIAGSIIPVATATSQGIISILDNFAPPGDLGTSAASLLKEVSIGNGQTLTVTKNVYATEIKLGNDANNFPSTLLINNAKSIILNKISATTANKGAVKASQDTTIDINIGEQNIPIGNLIVDDGKNVILSKLDAAQNPIALYSAATTVGNGSTLTVRMADGNFVTPVDGSVANKGTIIFDTVPTTKLRKNIGENKSVNMIKIVPLNSLETDGFSLKVGGEIQLLGDLNNPSNLIFSGANLPNPPHAIAAITTAVDGANIINVNRNLATPGTIGKANAALGKIVVADNVTFQAIGKVNAANDRDIYAKSIILLQGSTLDIQDGTVIKISQVIPGAPDQGTVLVNEDFTPVNGLGVAGIPLHQITIADNKTLTITNNAIYSNKIQLGNGLSALYVNGDGITVTAPVEASVINKGVFQINGNFTTTGDIGTQAMLIGAVVMEGANKVLTINNNIYSQAILSDQKEVTFVINAAKLTIPGFFKVTNAGGVISLNNSSTIQLAANHTFAQEFGSYFKTLTLDQKVTATFSNAVNLIKANNIVLNTGAILNVSDQNRTLDVNGDPGIFNLNGGVLSLGKTTLGINHKTITLNGFITAGMDWVNKVGGNIVTNAAGGTLDCNGLNINIAGGFAVADTKVIAITGSHTISNIDKIKFAQNNIRFDYEASLSQDNRTLYLTSNLVEDAIQKAVATQEIENPNFKIVATFLDDGVVKGGFPANSLEQKTQAAYDVLGATPGKLDLAINKDFGHNALVLNVIGSTTAQLLNAVSTNVMNFAANPSLVASMASGDPTRPKVSWWVQGLGNLTNQDSIVKAGQNYRGYKANSAGATVGLQSDDGIQENPTQDPPRSLLYGAINGRLGAAFSYASTGTKQRNGEYENHRIHSYMPYVYGNYKLTDSCYSSFLFGGGRHLINKQRRNSANELITGKYEASQIFAQMTAGFTVKRGYDVFMPTMFAEYNHMRTNAYKEQGRNLTVLSLASFPRVTTNQFRFGPQLMWTSRWRFRYGWNFTPSMMVRYTYDCTPRQKGVNVTIYGTAANYIFNYMGPNPERNIFEIQLAGVFTSGNCELSINYLGNFRNKFNSHSAFVKCIVKV